MLWDLNKIDKDMVILIVMSFIEIVFCQRLNRFDNYVRVIIYFYKWNNMLLNYLMLDIYMKNKIGQFYDNNFFIYIVIYGCKGFYNDILISVWDRVWFIEKRVLIFSGEVVVQDLIDFCNLVIKFYFEKFMLRKIWY